MKKLWWLLPAALLAAGSLLFMGCPTGSEDKKEEDLEMTDVFDLQEWFTENNVTAKVYTDENDAIFKTGWLQPAGNPDGTHINFEVVTVGAKKGIKIKEIADWGAGFDLNYAKFGFRAGDTIVISGEVITKPTAGWGSQGKDGLFINANHGAAAETVGGWVQSDEGEFEDEEITVSATDVSHFGSLNPKAFRITTKTPNAEWVITDLTVTGERPSGHIAVTGITGVPTSSIVNKAIELSGSVEPATATKTDITWAVKTAVAGTTAGAITADGEGKYIVTPTETGSLVVTATVADGVKVGTPFTKDFTITIIPPPSVDVTIGGGTAVSTPVSGGTSYGNSNATAITPATAGVTATGIASYATWVYLEVDVGAGKTAANINEVKVTIEGKSGDTNYKKYGAYLYNTVPTAYPGEIAAIANNNYTSGEQTVSYTVANNALVPGTANAQTVVIALCFHAGAGEDPEATTDAGKPFVMEIKKVEISLD